MGRGGHRMSRAGGSIQGARPPGTKRDRKDPHENSTTAKRDGWHGNQRFVQSQGWWGVGVEWSRKGLCESFGVGEAERMCQGSGNVQNKLMGL